MAVAEVVKENFVGPSVSLGNQVGNLLDIDHGPRKVKFRKIFLTPRDTHFFPIREASRG